MRQNRRLMTPVCRAIAALIVTFGLQPADASLFSSTLPSSRSVEVGAAATAFATIINAGAADAAGCRIEPLNDVRAAFSYQTTDPTTNAVTGTPDTPVTVAAGASQSFVFSVVPDGPFSATNLLLGFTCSNAGPAPITTGLNTLLVSANSGGAPDIIALALTATGDGVLWLPDPTNSATPEFGAFAVATSNLGAQSAVTVSARPSIGYQGTVLLCQTDPATGVCVNPALPTMLVTADIESGATPTFSIFARSDQAIGFDPAGARLFIEFKDAAGVVRGSTSVAIAGGPDPELTETDARTLFADSVSDSVIQAKCIGCHVAGGPAAATALVYAPATEPGHVQANFAVLRDFVDADPVNADRILQKARGVSHGGGSQFSAGSFEFAALSGFLTVLTDVVDPPVTGPSFWDGVGFENPVATLRNAMMMLAGRKPNEEERATVAVGGDAALADVLRGAMTGPAFHDFLLRGANDRLLTDKGFISLDLPADKNRYPVYANEEYRRYVEAQTPDEMVAFNTWASAIRYGMIRSPLELIARVVEQDLPYTEVLTADYLMMNRWTNDVMGGTAAFDDPDDMNEFQPGRVTEYYRYSRDTDIQCDTNGCQVLDPGSLRTDYPHAGVLNTQIFLARYPSTATNRNRARSRWTYYHFLDVDIEKSATRTQDPDALADRDNPTLNNRNCTVCHQLLDPVAGAYQNYGDGGDYRDSVPTYFCSYDLEGGMDSLPDTYRFPDPDSCEPGPPYRIGDTWYRTMLPAGLNQQTVPDAATSLQWLARRIASDPRFAQASVRFWWPALMGAPPLTPPASVDDEHFVASLRAFEAQNAVIDDIARRFRQGLTHRGAYNGRDLLVALAMNPWFRAARVGASLDETRASELASVGHERLLTPEELAQKTLALTGYQWHRDGPDTLALDKDTRENYQRNGLTSAYRLIYGGIDSDGIVERAGDLTPMMMSVGLTHAMESSCPIMLREMLLPDERRQLFGGLNPELTPLSDIATVWELVAGDFASRETLAVTETLEPGDKTIELLFENDFCDPCVAGNDRNVNLDNLVITDASGAAVFTLELEDAAALPGNSEAEICANPQDRQGSGQPDVLHIYSSCNPVSIPWSPATAGTYTVSVTGFADQAGPELPRLRISVLDSGHSGRSVGARHIKSMLVRLHDVLLNEQLDVGDPEIERSYELYFETWLQRRDVLDVRSLGGNRECRDWSDGRFYVDLVPEAYYVTPEGYVGWRDEPVNALFDEKRVWEDPSFTKQTWVVILAYMLSDYSYLYAR